MSRPKGYAGWKPRDETLQLIANIESILIEYKDNLPLTVRQIFYRLVGAYQYPKDDKAYQRLIEHLIRARRAGMIPFSSIRDDGVMGGGTGFDGPDDFWDAILYTGETYVCDRMGNQEFRFEVWCEAGGMVPQLQRVAFKYAIPVFSTGGFSSVTVTHDIAQRVLQGEKPTYLLHIGDYDPSGQSLYEAMTEDAAKFVSDHVDAGGYDDIEDLYLEPVRVALTPEQIDKYKLETAPPKKSDSRSINWYDETCQAEAMPPDVLAKTLDKAIKSRIDKKLLKKVIEQEAQDREKILDGLYVMPEIDGPERRARRRRTR